MSSYQSLGNGIHLLPLVESQFQNRAAGYLILGEKNVLVETGASPSAPVVLSALDSLGIRPENIDAIFVTHIHLDHAGGAGGLMQECKNAMLLLHPNGKKHLCQPDRLIEGARQVYGDEFDTLFSPILPVPEERVRTVTTGDILEIGDRRELRFFESFGHARHHTIAFDTESRGIFAGDIAGVFQDRIQQRTGQAFAFPNTAPTQFDPEEMLASFELMLSLEPESVFYTHFGKADHAMDVLAATREWIPFFSQDCVSFHNENQSLDLLTAYIQERTTDYLKKEGIAVDDTDRANLVFDNHLNAQGIIAYAQRLLKSGPG